MDTDTSQAFLKHLACELPGWVVKGVGPEDDADTVLCSGDRLHVAPHLSQEADKCRDIAIRHDDGRISPSNDIGACAAVVTLAGWSDEVGTVHGCKPKMVARAGECLLPQRPNYVTVFARLGQEETLAVEDQPLEQVDLGGKRRVIARKVDDAVITLGKIVISSFFDGSGKNLQRQVEQELGFRPKTRWGMELPRLLSA